jgi:lipopolysaccharide biosynthesis glycosyltransferase
MNKLSSSVIRDHYPILLVFDKIYSEYSIVLIKSILKNSKSNNFVFHLVTDFETNFLFQESFLIENNIRFNLYRLNIESLREYPTSGHITTGAYYLLHAMEIIDEKEEVLLYMDLDIFVKDDIAEVFELFDARFSLNCIYNNSDKYFSSGFILINNIKSKEIFTSINFYNAFLQNKDILWHDQDLLNIVFKDDFIKNIPIIWDFPVAYYISDKDNFHNLGITLENAKSIHFPGTKKPWRFSTYLPYVKEWQKTYIEIYKKVPWGENLHFKEISLRVRYFLIYWLSTRFN